MRSLVFTLLLVLSASVLGVLAVWQVREGSLDRLLGTAQTPIGEKIYPEFDPGKVISITLRSGDTKARFIRTIRGWEAEEPWKDRMDSRAALAILAFANTAVAEDAVPRDDLDPVLAGLSGAATEVMLKDESNESVAHFRLGRRTPWQKLTEGENPVPLPTTYLLPLERGRKSHVYAATGDILALFKDNFRFLRDHRPFYFSPLSLEKIRIRTAQGELTLGRADLNAPWRIVKPLDLPTDPAAVKELLEGLFTLQASSLSDRGEVTMLSPSATEETTRIAISAFGSSEETVLELLPPETPGARETQATVSDRPETLFTIPLKTEPDLTSISDLPLTVNDLRDPTLTNLNIASIRGIAIETATTPTVLISREPPAPWIATVNGASAPANEERLFDLLKAATSTRVLSFETDAAPDDLSKWGLERPILTLTFLAANNQALRIGFGLDRSGSLFAKREASDTIMRLDPSFLEKIAVNPHEWRHALLWSLSRVDLKTIVREEEGNPPLKLNYDFLDDKWQAFQAGEEATANLDPARANFVLEVLENLQVSRWLSPLDEQGLTALLAPTLTFVVTERTVDEFGDPTGESSETLYLTLDPETQTIYGKRSNEPAMFTITPEAYLKLGIPLLDE